MSSALFELSEGEHEREKDVGFSLNIRHDHIWQLEITEKNQMMIATGRCPLEHNMTRYLTAGEKKERMEKQAIKGR